jgi:hypothetical protein
LFSGWNKKKQNIQGNNKRKLASDVSPYTHQPLYSKTVFVHEKKLFEKAAFCPTLWDNKQFRKLTSELKKRQLLWYLHETCLIMPT